MPVPVREVRGIRRGTNPPQDVRATIYEPEFGVCDTVHSCLIHCPELFSNDKRIAGVDGAQALELAEMFVKTMFDGDDIDVVEVRSLP